MNQDPSNNTNTLTEPQLRAAYQVRELLSRPDAHLVEAVGSEGTIALSEPTVLTGEELRDQSNLQELLASESPWLRDN